MGIQWQKQELDLKIMKTLYEYRAVRGKTLVEMFSDHKQQTIYDRLRELRRMHLIDRDVYTGITLEDRQLNRQKKPRQLGKIYYLTKIGVEQTKIHVYNTELTGFEKTHRPEEKELEIYWRVSVILSNVGLKFIPARIFKKQKGFPPNLMIDLGYEDWSITFVRSNQESHRLALLQLARILELRGERKLLFLCGTRPQYMTLVKYLVENHVKGTYVLMQDDYENIRRLLTGTFMDDAVSTLQYEYEDAVEQLVPPVNGYNYRLGDSYFNIYPLLGYPTEMLRKLAHETTPPGFIMVADSHQYKQLLKHYPDYFKKHRIIVAEHRAPAEEERYKDWSVEINIESI